MERDFLFFRDDKFKGDIYIGTKDGKRHGKGTYIIMRCF